MKAVRLLLASLGLMALGACSGGSVQAPDFESQLDQLTLSVASGQSATPALGQTVQLTLQGHYTCQPGVDCPSSNTVPVDGATYTATPAESVTISDTGLVTTKTAGTVTITAAKDGVTSNAVELTVGPAVVTGIVVRIPNADGTASSPTSATVALGSKLSLRAYALKSNAPTTPTALDDTVTVNWTSGTTTAATVSPATSTGSKTGVTVTPVALGNSSIAAGVVISGSTFTASFPVTVGNASLLSVNSVTPVTASIATGNSQQFTAIGNYSDGSTGVIDNSLLNWTSDDTAVATVDTSGKATGTYTGVGSTQPFDTANITATLKTSTGDTSKDSASAVLEVGNSTVGCSVPFPANSSVDTSISALCLGGLLCSVSDKLNMIDADPENYAGFNVVAGLLTATTLSATVTAPTGTTYSASTIIPRRVGFVVGNSNGLLVAAEVGSEFTIDALLGGVVVASSTTSTTPSSPLTVDLLGQRLSGVDTALVSMQVQTPFDALRLTYNAGALSAIATRQVFSACSTATSFNPSP